MSTLRTSYFWYFFIFILFFASLIRFVGLGIFPPGTADIFPYRLVTATSGLVSIGLIVLLVRELSRNNKLALLSGFVLTCMPWHIEQSRIYSQPMYGLTVLLLTSVLITYVKIRWVKGVVFLFGGIAFYLVYPTFWIFSKPHILPPLYHYLYNLFKLISFEFIFYKNDSFWNGGFRDVGVLLPALLPFSLIGLIELCELQLTRIILFILPALIIWLIAAANPLFPEEREFFLVTPYIAILVSLGLLQFFSDIKTAQSGKKILALFLGLFILYEYSLFFHFYTHHYSNRIKNDYLYEKNLI